MSVVAILVALALAFLAIRFIGGVIKFAVLALIVIAAVYFLAGGMR